MHNGDDDSPQSPTFKMEPGRSYAACVWGRLASATIGAQQITTAMHVIDTDTWQPIASAPVTFSAAEWRQLCVRNASIAVATTKTFYFRLPLSISPGVLYFDDPSVTYTALPASPSPTPSPSPKPSPSPTPSPSPKPSPSPAPLLSPSPKPSPSPSPKPTTLPVPAPTLAAIVGPSSSSFDNAASQTSGVDGYQLNVAWSVVAAVQDWRSTAAGRSGRGLSVELQQTWTSDVRAINVQVTHHDD